MKRNSGKRAEKTLQSAIRGLSSLKRSIPDLKRAKAVFEGRSGDIIVTGIGKSGAIGEKVAATLTSLGHRALYLHPVDAIHGDIGALSEGDVLLALSYSGESKEVLKIVNYAKREFRVPVVSFTKGKVSPLGKISDVVVRVPIRDEGSPSNLAPMASTTAMLVLGDMLASLLTEADFRNDFAKFHPGGSLGLTLSKVESLMKTGDKIPMVNEDDSMQTALKEMSRKSLGVTGVIGKNRKLTGIITDGDIRRWLLRGADAKKDRAKNAMTKKPKTVQSGASLKEALKIMEDYRITTLFVTDAKKRPVGVVHIHDIVGENIV